MRHPYNMARDRARANDNPSMQSQPSKVFWNQEEKHKIAKASFDFLRKDNSLNNMAAIERAQQKVLRPERHRELGKTTFGQVRSWIEPMWQEFTTQIKTQADARQAASDLFTAPPKQPEEPETPPAMETVAEPEVVDEPELSKDEILAAIEERLPPESQSVTVVHATDATPPPAHTRKQVHWTDDEKEKLARRVHYLTKNFEDMAPLEALRKAIESELPEERHRTISTMASVEWLMPTLERIALDAQLEQARIREEQEARAIAEAKERSRIRAEAEAREQEIERRVAERVEAISFDGLIQAFARKLTSGVLNAVRDELKRGMALDILDVATAPAPAPETTPSPAAPAIKLPKVMIVGLFPNQEQDVERAFRGSIDFDFVKSQKIGGQNEGGNAMLRRGNGCDVVLVMSDSAGLDVEQKRKQITVPFRKIAGSSSNLKRWLTGYLNGAVDLYSVDSDV